MRKSRFRQEEDMVSGDIQRNILDIARSVLETEAASIGVQKGKRRAEPSSLITRKSLLSQRSRYYHYFQAAYVIPRYQYESGSLSVYYAFFSK